MFLPFAIIVQKGWIYMKNNILEILNNFYEIKKIEETNKIVKENYFIHYILTMQNGKKMGICLLNSNYLINLPIVGVVEYIQQIILAMGKYIPNIKPEIVIVTDDIPILSSCIHLRKSICELQEKGI